MPKLREPVDSLRDAQRHLTVFHSRALKASATHEVLTLTNEVIATIDRIINKLPQEPQEEKSFSDKAVSSALDLISKEVKKDRPKIDFPSAIKRIHSATNSRDAMNIGLEYGFTQEQIKKVMIRAPSISNLGKYISKIKTQSTTVQPKPVFKAPAAPIVIEDEEPEVTNDSDINDEDMDNDLKQLLGAK
jgi:ribosomal protein S7